MSESESIPSIPSLAGYSVAAVMRLAVACSGKTDAEIAAEMGWGTSVPNRVFSNQDYWPSLPNIPRFCEAVGNTILVQWILDNARPAAGPETEKPMECTVLLSDLARLFKELSRLAEEGHAALTDGRVSEAEARRMARALDDLFSVGCSMQSRLQATINHARRG